MGFIIFFLPFVEIYAWYLFINHFSFLDALFLAMTGGLVGLLIMTVQGQAALRSIQTSLAQGQTPGAGAIHRAMILLGGILIFLPGIISKLFGVLLVLPGSRHVIVFLAKVYLGKKIATGAFRVFSGGFVRGFPSDRTSDLRDVVEIQATAIEHRDISKKE